MTEQWFQEDIQKLLQHRNRVVLLDPTGQCGFLLPVLREKGIGFLETDANLSQSSEQEREELLLRHEAETNFKGKPLVFYVRRGQDKLSFLFDYCFTHGCLDLSHPQNWLKHKVFANTGLQVQLDNPMLLTAAKLGIGKDLAWWKKIVQDLEEVINLDDELLPFVHDPEAYMRGKDEDVKRLLEEKIHELLKQPYQSKPVQTLAKEVVHRMLDGLANNEISEVLLSLYHKWADSAKYRPSLENYLRAYKLDEGLNALAAHPDHCFEKLDRKVLKQISDNYRDKSFVQEKLQKLKQRIFSSKVPVFVPKWWQDVWELTLADTSALSKCNNLNAFITYYTGTFSKVDRAIRNLYESFLNEIDLIRPLQEHYDGLNHVLLDRWFGFHAEYRSDQQGYLPTLINSAKPKTAIIVGDGLRYEIAAYVASALEGHFKVDRQVMLADMPSETEHNMSALYVGNAEVLKLHSEREGRLSLATTSDIGYFPLEKVNYGMDSDVLVLTYKDIDSAGEKLQQAAIKLFSEFESVLLEKITLLLNIGYRDVYLITDHGFVLTGLLDEADKLDPTANGKKEVHERFIRTVEKQQNKDWLEFERPYKEFKYVYAAKNHRPFRSKGVYGFSHGGFTPQEIIIPKFRFSKIVSNVSELEVSIANKADLKDVPSELFVVKLAAAKGGGDLFGAQRKVQLKLYAGGKEIQSSDILSLDAGRQLEKEFSFRQNMQVQVVLLDATTQEQLDAVTIWKSNMRDLGGLL